MMNVMWMRPMVRHRATMAGRGATAGETAPVLGDGSASFTPGVSERRGSASSFYGADYLGTNSSLYSSGETVSATRQYDAFGNLTSSSGSSANPFGFAGNWGYQNDSDSGLKLLGHRYYDASTGRFLTRDPIKDGRNWYAYCGNDPIGVVDPTGLFYLGLGLGAQFILPGASGQGSVSLVYEPATRQVALVIDTGVGHGIGTFLDAGPQLVFGTAKVTDGIEQSLDIGGSIGHAIGAGAAVSFPLVGRTFTDHDYSGTIGLPSEGGGVYAEIHFKKTSVLFDLDDFDPATSIEFPSEAQWYSFMSRN